MLDLLDKGKRVINVDETWISETEYSQRMWFPSGGAARKTEKTLAPTLNMILALDTEGSLYYSVYHTNTDSQIMILFFQHLASLLSSEFPGWQDQTVLLLDNAAYHTSAETREALAKLEFQVIYTGPYSYDAAPCELAFAALKSGEINPFAIETSKK